MARPKAPEPAGQALARARIEALGQKARELLAMKAALQHLVDCCRRDEQPDCPILDQFAAKPRPSRSAR